MKTILKKDNYPVFSKKVMLLLKEMYEIEFVDAQVNKQCNWKLVYYYKHDNKFSDAFNSILKKIR